jgi:hypothetical protein
MCHDGSISTMTYGTPGLVENPRPQLAFGSVYFRHGVLFRERGSRNSDGSARSGTKAGCSLL